MRQARALPLPNETLYIEEIRFWLNIMQEHTKFIKAGMPVEAAGFLADTKEFNKAFTSLSQKSERMKSVKQSRDFIGEILEVMTAFEGFQRKILADIFQGKLYGMNFPFFIDHMLREAAYFCSFLSRMLDEKGVLKVVSHTRELVVWLRFMADHTKLVSHYIDPSERRMIKMAEEFVMLFDHLVLEARDLASMLYRHKGEVKVFRRFLLDIRADVQRLRDFNKIAEDLITDCRLLGIMSADLAAHMRREAEHCLLKIALLEKEFLKHCPDDFHDDADDALWEPVERNDEEEEAANEYAISVEDEQGDDEQGREKDEAYAAVRIEQMDGTQAKAEPVITIMTADEAEGCDSSTQIEADMTLSQHEDIRGEKDIAIVHVTEENTAVETETRNESPQALSSEPAYIKPMERQVMPKNFSPLAPRERYDKTKQLLPRPLGKIKK